MNVADNYGVRMKTYYMVCGDNFVGVFTDFSLWLNVTESMNSLRPCNRPTFFKSILSI